MITPTNSAEWKIYAVRRWHQRRDARKKRQIAKFDEMMRDICHAACEHPRTYTTRTMPDEVSGTVVDSLTERRCLNAGCNKLLEILS